jgi:hypothetical protein
MSTSRVLKSFRWTSFIDQPHLALLVCAVAITSGCGGGGNASPPPPQTHQVTSSGVVTLTVQ